MPGAGSRGRRRRPGLLLTGAAALVAGSSLVTLALVNTALPATPLVAGLTAAATSGQPADEGKGKGTPEPADDGKGKGKGTPQPADGGKGKGKGTPQPADGGKGKGTPQPTDGGKDKGTPGPMQVSTLAAAREAAGFQVRTLNGVTGAQLESVSVGTTAFATAEGPSRQTVVELRYSLGSTQVTVTEVRDPVALPASLRNMAEDVDVGGAEYLFLPATGDVRAAETRGPDGVSVVVNFFTHPTGGPAGGLDRQTAHELVRHLG